MRQIKYRAWDKRTSKMFPVAGIHFGYDGSALTITADLAPMGQGWSAIDNAIIHGESGILMQFTGRLDQNGVEIYEGDILEARFQGQRFRTVVEFERGMFCYDPKEEDGRKHALTLLMGYAPVVIGNIYDNEDLLNE